jgi:hypothetical protein
MRIRRILVGVVCTGFIFAFASPSASATAVTRVITVTGTQTSASFHGCCTAEFTERMTQHGATVGHNAVTCVYPSANPAGATCTASFTFVGSGTLFAKAITTDTGAVGAITGGTGAFTGARGTLLVVDLNTTGTRDRETFTFTV